MSKDQTESEAEGEQEAAVANARDWRSLLSAASANKSKPQSYVTSRLNERRDFMTADRSLNCLAA